MLFASRGRKVGTAIFDRRHRRLTQGMVGYWSPALTGPTGLQLLDLSGLNNHGTLTGMDAPTDWILNRFGSCLNIFDNQSVNCGLAPALNFTGPFSATIWVRNITSNTGTDFGILSKSLAGWNLLSTASSGGRVWAFWNNASRATGATTITSVTNWQLLGISWTGTTAQVWVNGLLDGSAATTVAPNAAGSDFHIGRYVTVNNRSMTGDFAEAGAWNRSLEAGEWQELVRLGPGGLGHPGRISVGIFEAFIAYSMLADSSSYALSGLPIPLLYGRAIPVDTASVLLQGQTTQLLVSRMLGADRGAYDVSGVDAGILLGRLLDAGATTYTVDGTSSGLIATRRISADSVAYLASGQDAAFLRGRVIQAGTGQYILVASPIDIQTGTGGAAPYYYLFLLGGSR